jgi:Ca2+-binding EF-hand superfamily protein
VDKNEKGYVKFDELMELMKRENNENDKEEKVID